MKINTLSKQIFVTSFTFICSFLLVIFILIYQFFPMFYVSFIENSLKTESSNLVKSLEETNSESLSQVIMATEEKNIQVLIWSVDENGETNLVLGDGDTRILGKLFEVTPEESLANKNFITYQVGFTSSNGTEYILQVRSSYIMVQTLSDALVVIIPYIFLVVLTISILISYLYSKIVAAPIIKLSNKSKQFAQLDFNIKPSKYGEDEIGQLNRDLDQMGIHMSIAIDKLNSDVVLAKRLEKERRSQLAVMSHELKTPLTILRGQTEMMISNIGKYKDRDKYLQENLSKIDKMQRMVSDILLSSDIEGMDVIKDASDYDLNKKIPQYISDMQMINDVVDINYVSYGDAIIPNVNISIFDQIIKNIIENAVRYTDAERDVNIVFSNNILTIENYNRTVTKENIESLFEPFVRMEKSRNSSKGGHGLGLYIVKKGLDVHKIKYDLTVNNYLVKFTLYFNS